MLAVGSLPMADLLKGLNDNAGALTAISTIVYAVITLAILFEARATRNLRREALMDTRLMAHQPAAGSRRAPRARRPSDEYPPC